MTSPLSQLRAGAGSFLGNVLFGLAFALGWHLLGWFLRVLQSIIHAAQ